MIWIVGWGGLLHDAVEHAVVDIVEVGGAHVTCAVLEVEGFPDDAHGELGVRGTARTMRRERESGRGVGGGDGGG